MTLELAPNSPTLTLPWIITFGPLHDDEEWEPVVCGPYERPHALAIAESVVADAELMAVVEPLQPRVSVDEIREDIAAAQHAVDVEEPDLAAELGDGGTGHLLPMPPPDPEEVRAGIGRIAERLPH